MVLVRKARIVVEPITFDEGGSNCLERRFTAFKPRLVKRSQDSAVELAAEKVRPTGIDRQRRADFDGINNQTGMSLANHSKELTIEKIQAEPKVDHGSDNSRTFYSLPVVARPRCQFESIFVCPLRIVFPKIDAVAQPIVIVVTWTQCGPGGYDIPGGSLIAAVVRKDETGGSRIQVLAKLFYQANAVGGRLVLFDDARSDEKLPRFLRIAAMFSGQLGGRLHVAAYDLFHRGHHFINYRLKVKNCPLQAFFLADS